MKKNSFNVYTLGCKVNQYDSNSLAAKLQAAGFVSEKRDADFTIINTCAVTKTALRKGRQMINRARRENPHAKVVLVGCAVKIYKEEVGKWEVDFVIGGNLLVDAIRKITKHKASRLSGTPPRRWHNAKQSTINKTQTSCNTNTSIFQNQKSRYFLKIQDGCRQFCTYCIIPYARGELKSRSVTEVLAEAKAVAVSGIKEIVLCGIHLGLYGIDCITHNLPTGQAGAQRVTNLTELIKQLIKIEGLARIRLSSIEVNEVTDELIELMKKEQKLCRHLHLPLQSGCDKILKLMNRPYTTEMFEEKIKKIRRAMPDIAITTDVIVGFPGETEKDFHATTSFIKRINFSKVHVFSFSAHERTPAAAMPNQVDVTAMNIRAKKLNDLSRRLEKNYAKKFSGRPLVVIIDGRSSGSDYRGRTEYEFDIKFQSELPAMPGELIRAENWELL